MENGRAGVMKFGGMRYAFPPYSWDADGWAPAFAGDAALA
jgi:hypothetical protein